MSTQNKRKYLAKIDNLENQLTYGFLPPQAPDLEGAVLGAILVDPECINDVLDLLNEDSIFYVDANQRVFRTIKAMFEAGKRIDFMTVCEELRKNKELEMVGGSYYVTKLTQDVVSSAHVEEHCRILIQKHLLRGLIKVGGEMVSDGYEDSTDVFDLYDKAQSKLEDLQSGNLKTDFTTAGKVAKKVLADVSEMMNSEIKILGYTSGYPELDRCLGGFEPGNVYVWAARPGVGKTALSLNMMMNCAFADKNGCPVGFFSLEMTKGQLVQRVLSNLSSVELHKIRTGSVTQDEYNRLHEASIKLNNGRILIDETGGITYRELKVKAKKMVRKYGVGLIIIDYLQLMSGTGKGFNREQEVAEISKNLKSMAKELNVAVIELSQLNRAVEKGEPQLHHLRESGSIEQDADAVVFLYKPDENETAMKDLFLASIAKNRHGKSAKFGCQFIGSYQRVTAMKNLESGIEQKENTFLPEQFDNHRIPTSDRSTAPNLKPQNDLPF